MQTIELNVEGMRCRSCVREVTRLLRDAPGVATVTADARTGHVTVTGEITESLVVATLALAGQVVQVVVDREG